MSFFLICENIFWLVLHTKYFSVVDERNFETQQVVRVGATGMDLNLTGLAFSPDSESIFVGAEQAVLEYSIDMISRRSFPTGSTL